MVEIPHQYSLIQDTETKVIRAEDINARDFLDRYYSAPWWIDLLFKESCLVGDTREPLHILEPFAGQELSLANRMMQHGHFVDTADIDPLAPVKLHTNSFTHKFGLYDAVVTNPPFTVKESKHIERKASDAVRLFVPRVRLFAAFLMRLSFFEPCGDRADILTQFPPDHVVVLPRFSFKKTENSSTDMITCAWFVWTTNRFTKEPTYRVASVQELERYEYAYRIEQKRRLMASR